MRPYDGDLVAAAQRRLAALAQHPEASASAPLPDVDRAPTDDRSDGGADEDHTRQHDATPIGTVDPGRPRHLRTLQGDHGRWSVTTHHLTVAALAVVALVIAVAWWSLRSVPHTDSVELSSSRSTPSSSPAPPTTVSPTRLPASPDPPGSPASVGPPSRLVVDVAGKVRRPGIVELPAGARVVDALSAAGGAKPGVSLTSLNLARLLVDGEQIVVGVEVPFGGSLPPSTGAIPGIPSTTVPPVNLNTATAEQLDTLPGVGPVTSQAILAFRTDNGPFTSVEELLEVSGIGDATLADLRPYVYV